MKKIKKVSQSQTGLRWLWVSVVLIIVDHLSKAWVAQHLIFQEPIRVLPFFNLTLAYNTGAAFSFLNSAAGWQNIFFTLLAFVVSLFLLVWLSRVRVTERWLSIGLCLILGGALGNAWDRLTLHYVIDFLSFHWGDWHFAIFNIADAGISVGAFMLFIHMLKREQ